MIIKCYFAFKFKNGYVMSKIRNVVIGMRRNSDNVVVHYVPLKTGPSMSAEFDFVIVGRCISVKHGVTDSFIYARIQELLLFNTMGSCNDIATANQAASATKSLCIVYQLNYPRP